MKLADIPVVATAVPPPGAAEDAPQYVAMPKMEVFAMPRVPERAGRHQVAAAAHFVAELIQAMERMQRDTAASAVLGLDALEPATREILNESLGQGEVSAIVEHAPGSALRRTRIQETAFAGVWRVQHTDAQGRVLDDRIEACEIPQAVTTTARALTAPTLEFGDLPAGLMNAPSVLHELRHKARHFHPGAPAHVVNLTLLPLTPEDRAVIGERLGKGPVTLLSRGFGNCRISSTTVRGIWRVQYFNTMETLILDTIEVVDVPEVARAAPEDCADSVERLRELLVWMRDG
jgi:hydrogenase-1 operon protein HyaF